LAESVSENIMESSQPSLVLAGPGGALAGILAALQADLSDSQGRPGELARCMDSAQAAIFNALRQCSHSPVVAQAMTLKILNVWLAKQHLAMRSTHVGSRPFALYIDPSNSCNLGCPGCVHSSTTKEKNLFDWKPGILSQSRLETLFQSYGPFAAHVGFYNYGDPLVNPLTPQFIKMAKSYLIQTAASTNLSFPKLDAQALVDSGLDFLTMSIDGATQPVYEKFRRKGKLDVVLNNIARLAEAKKLRNKATPILSWNFLAFEHNVHEIDAARQLAKDLGADQFSVFTPFDVSWDAPDIHPASVAPSVEKFNPRTAQAMSANFNPFPDELAEESIGREFAKSWAERLGPDAVLAAKEPGHACHWLYRVMVMDAGGRVLPCCCSPAPQRDLVFSEQDDQPSAIDHYNSPKYELARSYFADPEAYRRASAANGQADPYCVSCQWNQEETNFGGAHLQRYFEAIDFRSAPSDANTPAVFDAATLDTLCNW
jgi:MoaA/NifB/PqqE/SkfB family radical SAM enzyme